MQWMEAHRERHSDDGKPPVPWERYLEVAPDLAALDPTERPEALAVRELDPDTWARAEIYWMLTFAIDLQRGDTERADAFGRACAEAKAKLAARPAGPVEETTASDTPPNQAVRPVPADTGSAPAPPLVVPLAPEAVAALGRESAKELPSFLRTVAAQPDPAAPRAAAPVPPVLVAPPRATVELPSFEPAPGRAALPFAPASPGSVPVLASSPAGQPAQSGATVDLPAFTGPDLFSPPHGEGPAGARDRRTEAGTVELDPDLLAALFARKPPA